MKIVRASLVHQIQPAIGSSYADDLALGVNGVDTLRIDAGCLVVNEKKAVPLTHVLWMGVETGKK